MPTNSPFSVVQAQLDAYNAKDVEALLLTYAPGAEQFTLHPSMCPQADPARNRTAAAGSPFSQ